MPIKDKDKLSKVINNDVVSTRIESFVWVSLSQWRDELINIQTTMHQFRDFLADRLIINEDIKQRIVQNLTYNLIREDHLDWIVDSHRQTQWIEQYITMHESSSRNTYQNYSNIDISMFFNRIPAHLLGRMRNIAIFDFWAANVFSTTIQRINYCNTMKAEWYRFTKEDKQFSWLNENDIEQKRLFFHKWLKLKHPLIPHNTAYFSSHENLLGCIDRGKFTDAEKILLSLKSRNAWNQQQRRANFKGKRQCNFVLSERAIAKLDKLSSKYKLSRTEIIELLIDSESKGEKYISTLLDMKERLTMPI